MKFTLAATEHVMEYTILKISRLWRKDISALKDRWSAADDKVRNEAVS
jgi:hypothetical protein